MVVTPQELAARWHVTPGSLAKLRSRKLGLNFVKLPSGPVLYRVSAILPAEHEGYRGVTIHKVVDSIKTAPGVDGRTLNAMAAHVTRKLAGPSKQ